MVKISACFQKGSDDLRSCIPRSSAPGRPSHSIENAVVPGRLREIDFTYRGLCSSAMHTRAYHSTRESDYIELFKLCQRARTLPPTDVITAIAATTIKPAISAYSSTSP